MIVWEMQDVENFEQPNECNNEKGKRHFHLGTNIQTKMCTWQLQKRTKKWSSQVCQVKIISFTCNFYNQTNNM
jgi:hypothetical protein